MFIQMIELILVLIIFLVVKETAWWLTEEGKIPRYLNYKPWICYKCLGFWSLLATYAAAWYVFDFQLTAIVGGILTILDTIALILHERQTISLEDYDKLINKN